MFGLEFICRLYLRLQQLASRLFPSHCSDRSGNPPDSATEKGTLQVPPSRQPRNVAATALSPECGVPLLRSAKLTRTAPTVAQIPPL